MVWNGEKLESEQYHDVGEGKNGDRSKVRDEQGEESHLGHCACTIQTLFTTSTEILRVF